MPMNTWDDHYRSGQAPWDTGASSTELQRILIEQRITPCTALEIGCGTGTNAVWLAQEGFAVSAFDVSTLAIEQAKERARKANVNVRFLTADITQAPDVAGPFSFVFDRGCYHAVRRSDVASYLTFLHRATASGAFVLVLTGNAREPHSPGPPVVTEDELRKELGGILKIVQLREFRFDSRPGLDESFLGWSCLLKKA